MNLHYHLHYRSQEFHRHAGIDIGIGEWLLTSSAYDRGHLDSLSCQICMAETTPCQDISASILQSHNCFKSKGTRACDELLTCFEPESFISATVQSGKAFNTVR